ncbi:unnamed protein product [Caenorhabditis bovis]|uniref:Uncharacterized protein n=1 Tax=Caenorhabditis bovis TaxID=2654633 RepID=A0A8S1F3P2_9PELO|nr:unnamed protein product [Caenorhabditis bovis]
MIKRVEFDGKVFNKGFSGYILYSTNSAWIWIGEKSITSIGLANFPLFSMLSDGGNTQREFIKSVALRLTKKSRFAQIFFTTDIECEDAIFWKELNELMTTKLTELAVE